MKHQQFIVGGFAGLILGSGLTVAAFFMLDRRVPTLSATMITGSNGTLVSLAPATGSGIGNLRVPNGSVTKQFNGQPFYIVPLQRSAVR